MINHILEWIMTLGEIIVYLNEWSRFGDKLSLLWNFVYYEFWKSAPFKGPCGTSFPTMCCMRWSLFFCFHSDTDTRNDFLHTTQHIMMIKRTIIWNRSSFWFRYSEILSLTMLHMGKTLVGVICVPQTICIKAQLRLVLHCHLHHSNGKYKL